LRCESIVDRHGHPVAQFENAGAYDCFAWL
jgi:hypothetical protein